MKNYWNLSFISETAGISYTNSNAYRVFCLLLVLAIVNTAFVAVVL